MPFDSEHFTGPALELVRLSVCAAIGFGSPATRRQNRRIADRLIRDMVRLRQVVEKSGWVPMPPPGAFVYIPTPNRGLTEADGPAWRMAVQQTIADLVAACRKMVRRCWELAPDLPANGSDEGTIQKYNAAAQRALEESCASEAEVGDLTQRLWRFGQQARLFPLTTSQEAAPSAMVTDPDDARREQEAHNRFQLKGGTWHVRFEEDGEGGGFSDRPDSVLRHLARLLAEPNRHFRAQDFYPPPPGGAPLPHYGRDASSDDRAVKEYEDELKQLAQEIKEADDAHDTETAGRLREELERLADHLEGEKAARRCGHEKQCGTLSPEKKADQAIRVGLERLKKKFRDKGLPKLADHLDKYLDNGDGEWWYAPPPTTAPWHVIRPDTSSKN
jgi:hypothetical protein